MTFREEIGGARDDGADAFRVGSEDGVGGEDTEANDGAVGVEELLGFDPPDVLTTPFTDGPDEAEGPGVDGPGEAGAAVFGGGREGGKGGRLRTSRKKAGSACERAKKLLYVRRTVRVHACGVVVV
jgi:hypothetical protein